MAQGNILKEYVRTDNFIVSRIPASDAIVIYKYAVLPNHQIEYEYIGKNGVVERQIYKEGSGEDIKPWITLGGYSSQYMIPQLLDALIEFGFKPEKHVMSDEEKTAMKYHLEDMRRLVFKDKKV